jgi:hypothetical protein
MRSVKRISGNFGGAAHGIGLIGLVAALGVAGCAKASDPTSSSPLGAGPVGGSGSGGNLQQGDPQTGDDACTSCSSSGGGSGSGGGGVIGSDDASVPGDDATASDDGTAPPPGDDAGTPPFMFPPITLPDSGSTSTGDGGANACTTKICIDPVFDCPLQGCFNGCMNFFCQ